MSVWLKSELASVPIFHVLNLAKKKKVHEHYYLGRRAEEAGKN
jgi:hypothetical protein